MNQTNISAYAAVAASSSWRFSSGVVGYGGASGGVTDIFTYWIK